MCSELGRRRRVFTRHGLPWDNLAFSKCTSGHYDMYHSWQVTACLMLVGSEVRERSGFIALSRWHQSFSALLSASMTRCYWRNPIRYIISEPYVGSGGYQVLIIEQNRMLESLVLFDSVVNSRWFVRTSIILFLNKVDLFKQKLERIPLNEYFPDYSGGDDVNRAAKYLLWRFNQVNRAHLNLYPQLVPPMASFRAELMLTCLLVSPKLPIRPTFD